MLSPLFHEMIIIQKWHVNLQQQTVAWYRMARNFGGKIFWGIAENMSFGGIYFGGWARLNHITIFIAKWLIKRAGILTGLWASFRSVRTKSIINATENLASRCYAYSAVFSSQWSLQWPCTRHLDQLPRIDRQANSFLRCTKLFGETMSPYAAFKGELHAND